MGFDAAEIGLRGTITADPTNEHHVKLALRIDANNIALAHDGDRYSGQLRLALVGYQTSGRITNSAVLPLDLQYSGAERDKSLLEGIGFAQDVMLETDVDKLRFIVFDRGSNAIGSLSFPVHATSRR